ncbi:MAG: PDZ domain-containing protein [Planctomycetota bacterium]
MTHALRFGIGWFFAGLLVVVPGAAQPASGTTLEQLGHEDFTVRQTATKRLLLDDSLSLETLGRWADRELSLEQQHRLLKIAEHHALRQIRLAEFPAQGPGSIGVVQSIRPARPGRDETPERGVLITQVLPGFPGTGRLRAGDQITAINGVAIEEGPAKSELFQARMRAFRAGESITLTVTREGATLDVAVPLANGAALPQMYPPDLFKLAPRFVEEWQEERRNRFAALAPQLLKTAP